MKFHFKFYSLYLKDLNLPPYSPVFKLRCMLSSDLFGEWLLLKQHVKAAEPLLIFIVRELRPFERFDNVNVIVYTGYVTDNFLLVADSFHDELFQYDLITGTVYLLNVQFPVDPVAIAYHPQENKIYWTDIATKRLRRASLDGTGTDILLDLSVGLYAKVVLYCNNHTHNPVRT